MRSPVPSRFLLAITCGGLGAWSAYEYDIFSRRFSSNSALAAMTPSPGPYKVPTLPYLHMSTRNGFLFAPFVEQTSWLARKPKNLETALPSSDNSNPPQPVVPETIAVLGIPFDGAVTNRPGARFAPEAIRRSSRMLCEGLHPGWNVSPMCFLRDLGDAYIPNTHLEDARKWIEWWSMNAVRRFDRVMFLGGDHSITLSLLRGVRQGLLSRSLSDCPPAFSNSSVSSSCGTESGSGSGSESGSGSVTRFDPQRPFTLIHFDAHCDTWHSHFKEPSGHGTWVHEAVVEGLVDAKRTLQIGIRSAGEAEDVQYISNRGGIIHTARSLRGVDGPALADRIASSVEEIVRRDPLAAIYVTVDIDCLDPSFAPGTGTPEIGGMTSCQLLTCLETIFERYSDRIVGFDVCEVSPPFDQSELTSYAGATVAWTAACGWSRLFDQDLATHPR